MSKKAPSVENVLAALPAVQTAIKEAIAARIAAGEEIASSNSEAYREIVVRRYRRPSRATAKREAAE
jgi:hypothetical protein